MSKRNHQNTQFLLFSLFFLFLLAGISSAQSLKYSKSLFQNKDWSFVENKGQLASSDIHYYGHQGGVYLYCKPGIIEFVFTKVEKDEKISEATGTSNDGLRESPLIKGAGGFGREKGSPSKITTSRADLVLINSNSNAQILASDQQEYYENYYTTGNADSGITNVHTFKTITYKSIYPNIDLVLARREKGLEYSFVVYPGGYVSDIQMDWRGIERIKKLKNLKIEYACELGKIDEGKPVSFQENNRVESDFLRYENKVGFKVSEYDKKKVLVIDPTLEWGTYFGGNGDDEIWSMDVDHQNNVVVSGYTNSPSDIATSGSYDTTYNGSGEGFIAKFAGNGQLEWATYFDEYGWGDGTGGISVDKSDNIFFSANSRLTGLATSGAYQTSGLGFLAKIDMDGKMIWGTYYGANSGANTDLIITCVKTDPTGNVYIGGTSGDGFKIATSGGFMTKPNSLVTGFIVKFSGSGGILWGTYFGGTWYDEVMGFGTDANGNLYATGFTLDTIGLATQGSFQSKLGGNADAFLAKFNQDGNLQWCTYFGDTGVDYGTALAIDTLGDVYLNGNTNSAKGIATKGAYQTAFGGQSTLASPLGDAFIAKFNGVGEEIWATYFGGADNEAATAICYNPYGTIDIAGYTFSTNGISSLSGYQKSLGGGADAYLAEFSLDGDLIYGTYFGGNGGDWAQAVGADQNGNVLIAGTTTSVMSI